MRNDESIGITVYIRPLEHEKKIVEKEPEIIDDLRGGRRCVERVGKRIDRFYGGGNVSVSRPFVYSINEEGIVVHGADAFGSFEFPAEEEEGGHNNLKRKIEMMIVAGVVPDQWKCDIDRDTPEWEVGNMIFSDLEEYYVM
ncbi:hypothetical protein QQ045_011585 [Rhodiola kirilowii]